MRGRPWRWLPVNEKILCSNQKNTFQNYLKRSQFCAEVFKQHHPYYSRSYSLLLITSLDTRLGYWWKSTASWDPKGLTMPWFLGELFEPKCAVSRSHFLLKPVEVMFSARHLARLYWKVIAALHANSSLVPSEQPWFHPCKPQHETRKICEFFPNKFRPNKFTERTVQWETWHFSILTKV